MWSNLVVGLVGLVGLVGVVLFILLLAPAEHELKKLMRRHVDHGRRVIRAAVFFWGMAGWAYASYLPLYRFSRQWWFFVFLLVAGVWKLAVDVLIFGVSDRPDSAKPPS